VKDANPSRVLRCCSSRRRKREVAVRRLHQVKLLHQMGGGVQELSARSKCFGTGGARTENEGVQKGKELGQEASLLLPEQITRHRGGSRRRRDQGLLLSHFGTTRAKGCATDERNFKDIRIASSEAGNKEMKPARARMERNGTAPR